MTGVNSPDDYLPVVCSKSDGEWYGRHLRETREARQEQAKAHEIQYNEVRSALSTELKPFVNATQWPHTRKLLPPFLAHLLEALPASSTPHVDTGLSMQSAARAVRASFQVGCCCAVTLVGYFIAILKLLSRDTRNNVPPDINPFKAEMILVMITVFSVFILSLVGHSFTCHVVNRAQLPLHHHLRALDLMYAVQRASCSPQASATCCMRGSLVYWMVVHQRVDGRDVPVRSRTRCMRMAR